MTMRLLVAFCVAMMIALGAIAVTNEVFAQQTGGGNTGGSSSSGGGFSLGDFSLNGSTTGSTGNSSNNNFIGGAGNSGFIGGSSGSGTTSSRSTTSRNSTATRSTASRTNMNTGNRMGGGGTSINNQRQVQPVVMLGFSAPTPDYAMVSSLLSQRIGHTVQTGRLATVQVKLADGVAIVDGAVAGDHDKKVVENMIRLQPGVSRIQSNIQIVPSDAGQNALSPSAKRNQQSIEIPATTTPQGRPLVHVFQHSDEIPVTTTPQGQQLVHVF
jgi:hypothetical protein